MKTALSLYVAIAAHLLILLGLALGSGGWSQLPFGGGQGLGDGRPDQPAPLASETDKPAATALSKPQPQENLSPERITDRLTLASKPVQLTKITAPAAEARQQKSAGVSSVPRTSEDSAPIAASASARGSGLAGGGRGGYLADLRRHLDRHRRSLPGVLASARSEVAFTVAADGGVSALRLQKSSGVAALDQEALDLLRRAAPLPKPPDGAARELVVPVSVGVP